VGRGRGSRAANGMAVVRCGRAGGKGRGGKVAAVAEVTAAAVTSAAERRRCRRGSGVAAAAVLAAVAASVAVPPPTESAASAGLATGRREWRRWLRWRCRRWRCTKAEMLAVAGPQRGSSGGHCGGRADACGNGGRGDDVAAIGSVGGRAAPHGISGVCGPRSRAAGMAAVVAVALPAVALHQGGNAGRGRAAAGQQRRSLRWPRRRLWQRRPRRRRGSNRLSRWPFRNPLQRCRLRPLRHLAMSDRGGGGSGDGGGGSGGEGSCCVFGGGGGGGEEVGRSGTPNTLLVARSSND